jgi:hypothetical protein
MVAQLGPLGDDLADRPWLGEGWSGLRGPALPRSGNDRAKTIAQYGAGCNSEIDCALPVARTRSLC